jgi:hypothetical protein
VFIHICDSLLPGSRLRACLLAENRLSGCQIVDEPNRSYDEHAYHVLVIASRKLSPDQTSTAVLGQFDEIVTEGLQLILMPAVGAAPFSADWMPSICPAMFSKPQMAVVAGALLSGPSKYAVCTRHQGAMWSGYRGWELS